MSRRSFPRIDPATLRDHADEARVERIWERVEHDLESRAGFAGRRGRRSPLFYLAAAAVGGAFSAGLLLGKATWDRRAPALLPIASPVVEKSLVEVLAAGTQLRTFPLQGGGHLTLSPGATLEVERAGSEVTLSLLQGEASIASSGPALTIVAGDARINTQSGSMLSVRRNADDLDVQVEDGAVNVSSPAGSQQLGKSQRSTIPLHTTVASAPVDAKRRPNRTLPPRRPPDLPPSVVKASSGAEWLAHYPGDQEAALALLRKQGVAQSIETARTAAELNAIAELVGGGRDAGQEIHAYERLIQRFPSDQRAPFAARSLSRIYAGRGDALRAKEFGDKIEPLTKNVKTGSDALVCDMIRREPDKIKAALGAKEYLATYPDGECRDEFERLGQVDAPAPAPSSSADPGPAPPAPAPPVSPAP